MPVRPAHGLVLALLFLIGEASLAATPGFIVRSSDLRTAPSFSSNVVQRLAPGSGVSLLERRGGWRKVELAAGKRRGWVRTYQVREGQVSSGVVSTTRDDQRGVLSDLASLSRSASGLLGGGSSRRTSETTATIGIRGLSAEELEAAQADKKQLEQLKRYGASRDAGKRFGKTAELKKRKVDTLKGGS